MATKGFGLTTISFSNFEKTGNLTRFLTPMIFGLQKSHLKVTEVRWFQNWRPWSIFMEQFHRTSVKFRAQFDYVLKIQNYLLWFEMLPLRRLNYNCALFTTVTWHEVCREMSNKDEVIIVLQVPHDSFNITITAHPCSAVQMSEIKQYKRTGGLFISICLLIFIELTLVDFKVKSLKER